MIRQIICSVCFFIFYVSFTFSQTITNSVVPGGVTSNSARFWIRISAPATINVELSTSLTFTNSLKSTSSNVSEESNFAGIVDVTGLEADTKYFYRVLINDNVSDTETRSFQTFPSDGTTSTFSFGFGSCQQSGSSSGDIFYEIINHQLKFFLQLGDWGYYDNTDFIPFNNDFFPAVYSRVQATYANRFDATYPMDSLLKIMPVDYVYDDHDFMNNNSSALTSSFYVPFRPSLLGSDFILMEIENPVGARENSIKGYKENFPGYSLENESRGIYHKFNFGNAEFFAVDLRSQRSPTLSAITKNTLTGLWEYNAASDHSILGRENSPGSGQTQLDWFLSSLLSSKADWKFIISSVPFNKAQRAAIDIGLALQDSVLDAPGLLPAGTTAIFAAMEFADKWAGYQADLDSLLNFISSNDIKNVIVLSGDSHTAAIDDGGNAGLPEIMAGNLDITNSQMAFLFARFGLDIWNKGGQGITTTDFNDAFGKVTVYGSDSVRLSLIDEFGTEFASHNIHSDKTVGVKQPGISEITFRLFQNYPNPFNPVTTIKYSIASPGIVTLEVYNLLGEEIMTLINEYQNDGVYSVNFDAENLPVDLTSGIYFYKFQTVNEKGIFLESKKMIFMK